MPSSTFLRLDKEKQQKLLQVAKTNFAKMPLGEVSINQIIKEADISRGSFYMYFQDKEDLYYYLLETYAEQSLKRMQEALLASGGDPFFMFEEIFKNACFFVTIPLNRHFIKQVIENTTMYKKKKETYQFHDKKHLDELLKQINSTCFRPLAKKYLEVLLIECFHLLMANLVLVVRGEKTSDQALEAYHEQLELLQIGILEGKEEKNA